MPKLRFFLATLLTVSGSAMAADYDAPQLIFSSPDRTVNFVGGIGYSWIRADEKVYFEGDRLSHLIWTSQTPVFTAAMSINPLADLTIDAKTRIGFLSTSRMEDYDWFGPFFKSFAFDDWTHHSSRTHTHKRDSQIGAVVIPFLQLAGGCYGAFRSDGFRLVCDSAAASNEGARGAARR